MNESELLMGRPYGGCAILVNDRLKCKFTPLPVTKRCYAGILELYDGPKNSQCVYMPCDTTPDYDSVDEYSSVLADYIAVCNDHPNVSYTILAGDLNTDFSGGGGGGCYGGSLNPKSLIMLPLKFQIPKFLTPQIPKFVTPQIPNF